MSNIRDTKFEKTVANVILLSNKVILTMLPILMGLNRFHHPYATHLAANYQYLSLVGKGNLTL